jgi:hypothetical protein
MSASDHAHARSAWVDQVDNGAADAVGQARDRRTRRIGQPHQVSCVSGPEGRTSEARAAAVTNDDAGRTLECTAKLELGIRPRNRGKPERVRKRLSPSEVWLLKLQPREVEDLDHGIASAAGVLTGPRALLTVQVAVGAVLVHMCLQRQLLTKSSVMEMLHVKRV